MPYVAYHMPCDVTRCVTRHVIGIVPQVASSPFGALSKLNIASRQSPQTPQQTQPSTVATESKVSVLRQTPGTGRYEREGKRMRRGDRVTGDTKGRKGGLAEASWGFFRAKKTKEASNFWWSLHWLPIEPTAQPNGAQGAGRRAGIRALEEGKKKKKRLLKDPPCEASGDPSARIRRRQTEGGLWGAKHLIADVQVPCGVITGGSALGQGFVAGVAQPQEVLPGLQLPDHPGTGADTAPCLPRCHQGLRRSGQPRHTVVQRTTQQSTAQHDRIRYGTTHCNATRNAMPRQSHNTIEQHGTAQADTTRHDRLVFFARHRTTPPGHGLLPPLGGRGGGLA